MGLGECGERISLGTKKKQQEWIAVVPELPLGSVGDPREQSD